MIVRAFRLAFPVAIAAAACFAPLSAIPAHAADAELNVYNWSEYIAKTTIPDFQKQTGVHVRYDVYDSDDTLQSKLLAGSSGYDIVVPTSNYMAKQIQAGVYQKLDKTKLPNLANLDPALMKKIAESDPGNQYGVPWAYGTDGVGYNVQAVRKALGDGAPLDSWALVFDPANVAKLKGCGVSFLDAPDDVFAAALQYLGKDPNSKNPADYHAAFDMLKKVRPYITQFNSSGYNNDLANNDVCVVLGWSGDVSVARREAIAAKRGYEIRYANPKEGGILWFDVMAIPKDAPHPEAALQWINYIQDPKVNADITNEIYYPSANQAAHQYVTPAVAHDPNVYLPADVLDRMTLSKPRSADIARLENRLWQQLKTGN
ncbi:polyamine ABC transporter substrate-binding protein [Burkholderia lata]|uniref:Putrescine-binding periplasmic protein n=1 Tax=Burkholderia lata (strain ATCC 17760 / DSM 23089 / LMG 22485 / NCIMB 9086 / R18194 / 383) TaxID=482957 RepID=A0A6P2TEF6_BURL3|nr:polyamine ABC transporter substrate-binding protein [Burkholderia lata]VWC58801.1 ABC transporter substrate-binding protein [Burkholderia lata]